MILTNCAACAAPLAHDAPRCVRCKTRYCDATCQHDHWRRGHKQICKRIHREGNAEQYYADKKYKEAVAVAVEKCADDTRGQTCYICMEAIHARTGEGLVRGCACGDRDGVASGTTGIAHVSCLAEQAKILCAEAFEDKLGSNVINERWVRWHTCSLCEHHYHGVVMCALGWACWKTYLGLPERHWARRSAMGILGSGLFVVDHHQDAVSVREAELSMERRLGGTEQAMLVVQANLASTYEMIGRPDEGLRLRQDVYLGFLKLNGEENGQTLMAANNYAVSLNGLQRFEEAKSLLRKTIPIARRLLGNSNDMTLKLRRLYAAALNNDPSATLADHLEAVGTFEEIERTARRVLGGTHPQTADIQKCLQQSREAFAAAVAPHHTSSAQQVVRIEIGEPIPTGIGVGPAFLMVAFAAAIYLCFAWGASTAPEL